MNRSDFQNLTKIRVKEAKALLGAGHFAGAYYLSGYAVEFALKACVAKKTLKYDFPSKETAKKVFTHNLAELVGLAGLKPDLEAKTKSNANFEVNWTTVKDWSEEDRYRLKSEKAARDLYEAITQRGSGILPWLKIFW